MLPIFGAVAFLVATVGVARLVMTPAFRRETREHPRLVLALLAVATLSSVGLGRRAVVRPTAVHALATATVAVVVAAWWRARPAYGRTWGLPPGSLGLGVSLDAIADEEFYARASRRWGPIFKVGHFHRRVACVVDLPVAVGLLQRTDGAVQQVDWPFDRLVPSGYVEFMNDDRHTRLRSLLGRGLAEHVIAQCQSSIERTMAEALDELARQAHPDGVDPAPFVERAAIGCLLRVVLGVEATDARVAALSRAFGELDAPVNPWLPVPSSLKRAFGTLTAGVCSLAESARESPGSSLVAPSVLAEIVRLDRDAATDPAVVGNLATMVHDGRAMLGRLLLWELELGCAHPDWVADFRRAGDPGEPAARELARSFVLEVLRLRMTPHLYRRVARDLDLGPYRIPKGWLVRLCLREAHRRAEVFPAPDVFDPSRFHRRTFTLNEFCPFSIGAHACPADTFVVTAGQAFIARLALSFDGRVSGSAPFEPIHNRHWSYWRPSRSLRVSLTPRKTSGTSATLVSCDAGEG